MQEPLNLSLKMASIRPVPQSPINADTSSCIETAAAPGGGAAAATTARAQTNKRASLQAQRNPRPSDHKLQSPTTSSTTSTAAALLQEAIHNLCPPEDNAHNPNPADHLPTLASSNRNSETMAENDLASRSPPINGLPPPFLTKTYDIVDDPCTDGIVSWARGGGSFVVWDLHAFSAQLLPKFFKHNNYSSFVRQLNTYGFRKVDPDRWEFANDGFVRGHKYLLKLIQRRKSHHQSTLVCTVPCATEMVGTDMVGVHGSRSQCELFESMKRDKDFIMMEIIRLRQHQQSTLQEMKAMLDRLRVTEHRQHQMVAFLARAIQNPAFMAQLVQKNEMSKGLKAIKKKRCLPDSMCNIGGDFGGDFDDAAEESRVSETADSSKTTAKMDVQISGYGHEALDVDNPDSDKLLEFLEPDVDVESAHLEALLQEMGHTTTKQDCTEGKLKPHMSALPHAGVGNMLDAEIGQGLSQGAQFGFSGIAKKGENPHSLEDIGLLEAGDIDVLWEQLMLGIEDDSKVDGKRATRGCNQCRYASNSM